jgi:hypothetical protein
MAHMPEPVYCADCSNWSTKNRNEARVGLGQCKAKPQSAGHFVSGGYPRECDQFKPADIKTVEERARLLGE